MQQHETSAGNLSADFYLKPNCARPADLTTPKPASTDRDNVLLYNYAIRRHNKELEAFGTCIDSYTGRASLDIDWILFAVNTAIAVANNSNPPSAPAAPGNMPSGFYPAPDCIKPEVEPGAAPSIRDVKAMDAHNARVKTFNALAGARAGGCCAHRAGASLGLADESSVAAVTVWPHFQARIRKPCPIGAARMSANGAKRTLG